MLLLACDAVVGELPGAPVAPPPQQGSPSLPGPADAGLTGPLPTDAGAIADAGADAGAIADAGTDPDPLVHLRYLATDSMRGRDSPSPELELAGDYVRALLERHGVEGPNPADPHGAHFQSFSVVSDWQAQAAAHDGEEFGVTLFERGHYLGAFGPEPLAATSSATLAQNVLGLLRGTGPRRKQVIVLMAHLDHVGVGSDGVRNGADDNASGSSVLLSAVPLLAAAAARGELDRSVLFLWTAAEEKGLVGAKYFVDHPLPGHALADVAGVVNLDMVGRWGKDRLSVIDADGAGRASYFRDLVQKANQALPTPFSRINHDIDGYRARQDGAVFTGKDVLVLFEGLSNAQGGGSLIPEYHRSGDDLALILRDNQGEKLARVRDLLVKVALAASVR